MPSSIAAADGEDAGARVELRATTDGLLVAESPHAPAIKTNDTNSRLFTVADASTTSAEAFASAAPEGTFTSNDLLRRLVTRCEETFPDDAGILHAPRPGVI
jgi:hypothetical protein